MIFTGLSVITIDYVLDWMLEHRFNVVRIPISVAFALSPEDTQPRPGNVGRGLRGKSIFKILEMVVNGAARRGILVMLDMHTLVPHDPSDLWVSVRQPTAAGVAVVVAY